MTAPVLLCTDFSPHAETAFPFAVRFARALGVGVRLVHVSDVDVFHAQGSAGARRLWEDELLRYINERLEAAAQTLRAQGVEVETRVRTGVAAYELLEEARQGVSLAVLATRGHGGIMRAILGSVAARFVQASEVPTLCVPHGAVDGPIRQALLPVDFSELTSGYFGAAVDFAKLFDARIELFHAMVPIETGWGGVVNVSGAANETVMQALSDQLVELATHAQSLGAKATWSLGEGPLPARVITDRAANLGADLIMMAGHGRTGIRRLLLGSVTESVVSRSDRPVLVLKRG